MNYEEFLEGVGKYWELFESGLKKQANEFLFEFTDNFTKTVPREQGDAILERFCRAYFDEGMSKNHQKCGGVDLPFQLTRLISEYLGRQCEQNKMPQMRWAYQLFVRRYNPHHASYYFPYSILERAYNHPERDAETAELFFGEQLDLIGFGAHHFPDGCCIAREEFENAVMLAKRISSENHIRPDYLAELEYYRELYSAYYEWNDNGRNGDFAEACKARNIRWNEIETYYYN